MSENDNNSRVEVIEENVQVEEDEIDVAVKSIEEADRIAGRRRGGRKKSKRGKKIEKPETQPIDQSKVEQDVKDLANAYVQDENLKLILQKYEKDEREHLRKKLKAKIYVKSANRKPENEENVQRDEKGRKIGRLEKQYIDIPQGEIDNPFDMQKLQQVILSVSHDPEMRKQFIEKSGLTPEQCEQILAPIQGKEPVFKRVEEVL